jgi:hypothetical protein
VLVLPMMSGPGALALALHTHKAGVVLPASLLAFPAEARMTGQTLIGGSDGTILRPGEVTMTLQTAGGPLPLSISLAAAGALLVRLRGAADHVHRLRQDRGDPHGKAVDLADRRSTPSAAWPRPRKTGAFYCSSVIRRPPPRLSWSPGLE